MSQSVVWSNRDYGRRWVQHISLSLSRPCLVLLSGPMGAGKTQVARWLFEALHVSTGVQSPTFAIHHRYSSASGDVDHVDLYRLASMHDLESTGFWDLFQDPQGFVVVEWANRLPMECWPPGWHCLRLQLELTGEESRTVQWELNRL